MAKKALLTIKGTYCKVNKGLLTENGVYNKVKKAFITIGGVYRPFWSSESIVFYGQATSLNKAKSRMVAATVGNYALFGGGLGYPDEDGDDVFFSEVEAYDTSLTKSNPRSMDKHATAMASATLENRALIFGGYRWYWDGDTANWSRVDVYDSSLTKSTATDLSKGRGYLAATTVGGYALVGGGAYFSEDYDTHYSIVESYNTSLTKGSVADLTMARSSLSAATVGNYALFVGGNGGTAGAIMVDAYDSSLTKIAPEKYTTSGLYRGATSVGRYALFRGYNSMIVYDNSLTRIDMLGLSYNYEIATTLKTFAIFYQEKDYLSNIDVETFDESLTKNSIHHSTLQVSDFGSAASVGDFAILAGGEGYDASGGDYFESWVWVLKYSEGD